MKQNEQRRSPGRRKSKYTHRNRQVHIPDEHLAIGLIVGVHGLRGEVKIELHTDFPERFTPGVMLKLNSGFGLTEKAVDFAPEIGVLFTF